MSFSQALSGLRAQAENIKVVSNNIANSQTTGYKGGRASFADIFAGASPIGLGVRVSGITQDFRSGNLENTGRELDMAIAGQGFFRMEKTNGEVVYSRNGEFIQDRQGYLVNSTGQRLSGFGLSDEEDAFSPVVAGGAPRAIQIPRDDIPANATTEVNALYNLDASINPENTNQLQRASILNGYGEDAEEVDIEYHFSSSYTTFDSLGNERSITTYYRKIADNEWQATIAVDGVSEGFEPGVTGGNGGEITVPNWDLGPSVALVDADGNASYPVWDKTGGPNGDGFDDDGNPVLEVGDDGYFQFVGVEPADAWPLLNRDGGGVFVEQQEGPQTRFIDPDDPATEYPVVSTNAVGNPVFVETDPGAIVNSEGENLYPVWDGTHDAVSGLPNFDPDVPASWTTDASLSTDLTRLDVDGDGNLTVVTPVWLEQQQGFLTRPDGDPLLDGTAIPGGTGGDGNPGANAFTVNFDSSGGLARDENGNIIGVAQGGESGDAAVITIAEEHLDGAAELVFELNLRGTTQFNNNSVLNALDQDGYTSGTLIGLEVTDDGRVIRLFTNEQRRDAGQIVLTNFINPEGLQPDGDNGWRQTNASGEPILGIAGTGIFGTVESQTLENSNVDLAQELVDMIIAQRAYQANSSSIGTQDEMLQTIINL